jgi:hypothetical protein
MEKLMYKRKKWRGYNRNALCLSFLCVNDNKEIDNKCHQLMRCFPHYHEPIKTCHKRTKPRKCLIFYYKTNGITSLKNHVDANHVVLYKKIEKKDQQFFEKKCRGRTN